MGQLVGLGRSVACALVFSSCCLLSQEILLHTAVLTTSGVMFKVISKEGVFCLPSGYNNDYTCYDDANSIGN